MRAYGAIFRWIRRWLRHRLLDVRPQYACVASSLPPRLHPESVVLVFSVIALIIMGAMPAWATDVLVVQSSRNQAYEEALRGFRSSYGGSVQTVVLSDYAEVDVPRLVREEQPRLVLAIGDQALTVSRKVRSVPVESLMALSLAARATVNGIGITASPERYLNLLKSMGSKRVGVVYDSSRTGGYVKRAQQTARRLGMEIVARDVHSPRDVIARLEQLKGSIDALWMLPDTTAVTADTVAAYCSFSLEQRVPLVTFSAAHLDKGAVAALEVDRSDMGRQAGELAAALLDGTSDAEPAVVDARKVHLHTNGMVAKKLGISLSGAEKAVLPPRE